MNLRWLWLDHFPMHVVLSPDERVRIKRRARSLRLELNDHPANAATRRLWLMIGVPMVALWFTSLLLIGYTTHLRRFVWVTWLFAWIGIAFIRNRTHAPFVYLALREFGHDVCGRCGYDLARLPATSRHCPECGQSREAMDGRSTS